MLRADRGRSCIRLLPKIVRRLLRNHADQLLVLDMPLLFETKADDGWMRLLVVTAPPEVQKARVLQRRDDDAGPV